MFRRGYSDLPLLNLEQIFLDYNPKKEEYICYIKMQKCEIDLQETIEKKGKLKFRDFFPMFRDAVFGITFLHGHFMAHRDIKPNNIMKLKTDEWRLLDYGIGENIKVLAEHSDQISD